MKETLQWSPMEKMQMWSRYV